MTCKCISLANLWTKYALLGRKLLHRQVRIKHNTQTGRWVVPFRPAWSPDAATVAVGDMKRGVSLFNASSGGRLGMLAGEVLTAIPSRLAMTTVGGSSSWNCLLAAATSSGRVHVFR